MNADPTPSLEALLRDPTDEACRRLLDSLHSGQPVEPLRTALESTDDAVVRCAAWIASELGGLARPLLASLLPLLQHPSRYVRFFVLDAVFASATPADGAALACAMARWHDPDAAVRWKLMSLLAAASLAQLGASAAAQPDAELARLTAWLAEVDAAPERAASIAAWLQGGAGNERRMAAVAAARAAPLHPDLLALAASSADEEVRSFAAGLAAGPERRAAAPNAVAH